MNKKLTGDDYIPHGPNWKDYGKKPKHSISSANWELTLLRRLLILSTAGWVGIFGIRVAVIRRFRWVNIDSWRISRLTVNIRWMYINIKLYIYIFQFYYTLLYLKSLLAFGQINGVQSKHFISACIRFVVVVYVQYSQLLLKMLLMYKSIM